MVELIVPVSRNIGFGNVAQVLPDQYLGNTVMLQNARQGEVLSQIFGGRKAMPRQPIVLLGPDGRTPILLVGLGVTEVAELEDMAQAAYEKGQKRLKDQGSVVPTREYRERRGLPSKEQFDTQFRAALSKEVERQKGHKSYTIKSKEPKPSNGS